MKSFIVYNSAGKILRTGTCASSDLGLQAQEGEHVLEGVADDATQMVVDNEVIEKPKPSPPSTSELNQHALEELRITRSKLLAESDWTQLPDVTFNVGVKASWAAYRQDLRNVPNDNADCISIDDIVWPSPPS